MVDRTRKVLFVHVPKCAGQSIETYFLDLYSLEWSQRDQLVLRTKKKHELGPSKLAHLTSHEYLEYKYVTASEYESFFKFSFIRNTYSRVVSIYKYSGYSQLISFENFVVKVLPKLLRDKKNWLYRLQSDFTHFNNKLLVDFLGEFEKLDEHFEIICKRIGTPKGTLKHINKTISQRKLTRTQVKFILRNLELIPFYNPDKSFYSDYRKYYTTELVERVKTLYRKDIELYQHTYD